MFKPKLPPYDINEWEKLSYPERLKMACQAWVTDGYGAPWGVYILYTLKILFYIGMWAYFCTFTPGYELSNISTWWASPEAFQKAIFWTMLFEGLGLGCGSGPLSGRYIPPIGGALYFLRPGTTKLPLFPGLPILGGLRRTPLDVVLYATQIGVLIWACTSPSVTSAHILPMLVLMPLLGVTDRTLFLCFRTEHYLSIAICLLFTNYWLEGSKFVWMAIWWGAAISKMNHHFPFVMAVMNSNAPLTGGLRSWLYTRYPEDLRPSTRGQLLAHFGTTFELIVPVILLMSGGGPVTAMALISMTIFHLFILSNVPLGVPLEWNVIMIYGAFVLFGVHADVGLLTLQSPMLWTWLLLFHVALPVYGSMYPHRVSFLLAMRYYAGNWAYSIWLFRGESYRKTDRITKWAPFITDQIRFLYDDKMVKALLSRAMAWRHMHLQGRVLRDLVPMAVDNIDDYLWIEGEMMAGMVVGWNFGEGHLSQDQLLASVQAQCGFEEGELRCIFVEPQPIHRQDLAWRIVDAKEGELSHGSTRIHTLLQGQPWGELERQTT